MLASVSVVAAVYGAQTKLSEQQGKLGTSLQLLQTPNEVWGKPQNFFLKKHLIL